MRYTLPTDVVKLESSYVFRFLQQYFCMNLFFLYLSCSGFVTILWFSFYFSVSNAPYKLHSVILIFRFQKVVRKKKFRVVIPMLPSNLWRIWNTVGSVHTQIGIREDPSPPKKNWSQRYCWAYFWWQRTLYLLVKTMTFFLSVTWLYLQPLFYSIPILYVCIG